MKRFETYRGVVYPWLCDAMGHMATKHYMAMFDDAAYHFLAASGYAPREDKLNGLGWADVRHVIDYKREVEAGSLITIFSYPTAIGRSRIEYTQVMTDTNHGAEYAVQSATTVRFDLIARKSIEHSPEFKRTIETWLSE